MENFNAILPIIKKSHLFKGLSEHELQHLGASLVISEFVKDELIYRQGSRADSIKLIISGSVRLVKFGDNKKLTSMVLSAGDTFGENALFPKQTFSSTAIADEKTVIVSLPRKAMGALVDDIPQLRENFVYLRDCLKLAKKQNVDWLNDGEKIYAFAQKHPFLLALKQTGPGFLLFATAVGLLSSFLYGINWGVYLSIALIVLALGWNFWQFLDWQNDYYIITNQRVVWLEKVIILYDSRSEASIDNILSVNTAMSFFGRMFNFGTVNVKTYTGQIKLQYVNKPLYFAAIVEEFIQRNKGDGNKIDQENMKKSLMKKLNGENPQTPPDSPTTKPTETGEPDSPVGFWSDLFKMRTENGNTITYHKHIFGFFRDSYFYALAILGIIFAIFFWNAIGYFLPLWFYILLILTTVLLFFVIIYQYWDWKNDIYQVTLDQILDINRKPLGDDDRKSAPLENILSIEYKRNGIFGILFNFGTVFIKIGNSEFNFVDVADPPSVQQDIIQRQLGSKKRKSERSSEAENEKISEWLKAYHQIRQNEQDQERSNDL